ncbi:hypothetical protein GCM10010104_14810 [Streptomyces indiaensis]|uniref:Uncharacterized protein n=1 Tax=Streptomyces indiaensis TaxID=284033 RepID=A0ABN3D8S8_9ACTN
MVRQWLITRSCLVALAAATRATRDGTDGQPLEFIDGDLFDLTFTFLDVDQPVTVQAPPSQDIAGLAASVDEVQTG